VLGSPPVENGIVMKKATDSRPRFHRGRIININNVPHIVGAGKAFVRLEPDSRLFEAKLELANRIYEIIDENRWKVSAMATALGTPRWSVHRLLRGDLRKVSLDRLVTWLGNLGLDTEVAVRSVIKGSRARRPRVGASRTPQRPNHARAKAS
jgi:predicted XRE-type DNA-binding protein